MLSFSLPTSPPALLITAVLALPVLYLLSNYLVGSKTQANPVQEQDNTDGKEKESKSIMQPPKTDLDPPKDDPYTQEELKAYDGSDSSKPIYVAIKGTIFDVTRKTDVYGPGRSYNIFAGKDGSKGLGKSSLKTEDAVPDHTDLPPDERKVLDDWHKFFSQRYNIVGRVSDLPEHVAALNNQQ